MFNGPQVKSISWRVAGDKMWRHSNVMFPGGAVSPKLENALEMHADIVVL